MIYIPYELFVTLYKEAQEYNDMDLFIAERGWQEWMDSCSVDDVTMILKKSFLLSKMQFVELRNVMGLSAAKLADKFAISKKTLEKWESGDREPSIHTKIFFTYAIFLHVINRHETE